MMKLKKLQEQKNAYRTKSTKEHEVIKPFRDININIYNIRAYISVSLGIFKCICLPLSFLFFRFF